MDIRLLCPTSWRDQYELLDSGEGFRLERFGDYIVSRPDPQAIWEKSSNNLWEKAQLSFRRTSQDKGVWHYRGEAPSSWTIQWENIIFSLRPTPFKHVGVFPEQAVHWSWMHKLIKERMVLKRQVRILNLFAYTGGASLACAAAGAEVTHVDASKQALSWARHNQKLSDLVDKPIRYIYEDALTFAKREARRKNYYEAIIMDPPVYGHGPHGERWDFRNMFQTLMRNAVALLSEEPLFILINAYAVTLSSLTLFNILADHTRQFKGRLDCGELGLREESSGRTLSTGIYGSWQA